MGLTDEQRAEVQRLLTLRSQDLAKAPEEKWAEVIEQSELNIADILTPAQKVLFPKVFNEKTIRIAFRMQSWADVLQWFAEQAGLQLVMDSPPPGTFNYVDQIDYTPAEAIDKLNSVLQTKGYTLVRNDKMLMLFDLKRGRIPVQFLPKLKVDELPQRGRFEYTTVIFPLAQRKRSDVIQTIEPFKGPFCQIIPMPGNSLMITDTASTLLVLQKVIESVENPPIPVPPAPPVPTPTVWKTYLVEQNEPVKIEEIFKQFSPNAKILRIGNSKEIHVQLPEAEQKPLDDILKMLEADTGALKGEMLLESYSIAPYLNVTPQQLWNLGRLRRASLRTAEMLNPFDPSLTIGKEIIDIMKKTFPAAIVSETPVANNVVVLAAKAEHEKIKTFFNSLIQTPRPEDEPSAKVYRYTDKKKKMSQETIGQLEKIVPTGLFSLDEEQGCILVIATAKEQEMLTKAVTELETATVAEEDRQVVSYRMTSTVAVRFASLLRQLSASKKEHKELYGITELKDTKQGYVTVWATAKQHEIIRSLLDEMLGRKPAKAPEKGAGNAPAAKPAVPVLAVYPMFRGYAYTAQTVLMNLIPDADYTYDFRTNAVIAVALPELQPVIEKAVSELDKGYAEDVAFFTLKRDMPVTLTNQITRLAPHTVLIQDKRNLQVIATGPKQELDKIKAILASIEETKGKEEVLLHTLQSASPSTAVAVLEQVFPEVKATVNAAANQLIIQLTKELKAPVADLLNQLDVSLSHASLMVVNVLSLSSSKVSNSIVHSFSPPTVARKPSLSLVVTSISPLSSVTVTSVTFFSSVVPL
ncbi:hypothetical protein FACS189427_10850 [Planctomycetales bacterium]|nr:hypothetical protein FACS189427_10850 [Planctomycetales bacterium]